MGTRSTKLRDLVNESKFLLRKQRFVDPPKPSDGALCNCDNKHIAHPCSRSSKCALKVDGVPVYIKTYGCQMNVNDTSTASAILQDYGYKIVAEEDEAEIYLLMTCAIRESAEDKIWTKLTRLRKAKRDPIVPLRQVGVLGCMAERLKDKLLGPKGYVDIVAGPDAYRDLPRLLSINRLSGREAINCLLSVDETYSDVKPVIADGDVCSYVSITRGCDNLCSYCVVPFTRGVERSRPIVSILDEVQSQFDQGVRDVTLLGQNVNSYNDVENILQTPEAKREHLAAGFKTVYKPRLKGITFDVLLEEVAKISPELRVRFTSPHPKDFNDDVIDVIAKYPNITRCIHLPAQSGSDIILQRMRRGYTRESYVNLVKRMRAAIPELVLTSDFISGFCGETEADHAATLELIYEVKYEYVYTFAYSQRSNTHANYNLKDDVDYDTKRERVMDLVALYRKQSLDSKASQVGTKKLVMIEGVSPRNEENWVGRTNTFIKTIIPRQDVFDAISNSHRPMRPGDYVETLINFSNAQRFGGQPLLITTQAEYTSRPMDAPRDRIIDSN